MQLEKERIWSIDQQQPDTHNLIDTDNFVSRENQAEMQSVARGRGE